jgi:hypothetical protein
MIMIRNKNDKDKLKDIEAQTILTLIPDIEPPKGCFIVNMTAEKAMWKISLFERARQLGKNWPAYYPYTYAIYYIMRMELDKKGAEGW